MSKAKDLQHLAELVKKDDKINGLKAILSDIKGRNKLIIKQRDKLEADLNKAMALKKKTKPLKVKAQGKQGQSESTAILQTSDWHIADVIRKGTVHKNEFNLEICDERIEKCYQKTVEMVEIERSATKITDLVWHWGGDLVNGVLRDEDLENNSLSPLEEGIWLKQRLQKGVEYFLKHFERLIIPCSPGNHGRMTQKLRIATEHQNSIEYMVYSLLANEYADNDRVTIENPKNTFTWVDVYGRDCRFHHGTFIKGGAGIGGVYPSLFKYIHRQNQTKKAFMDFLGHLHAYTPGENFLINPALIGYGPYAQSLGYPYEPAAQALTFVEKNLGVTSMRKLYLQ